MLLDPAPLLEAVPGSAADEPDTVTTTASAAGTAPKNTTRASGASRTPAMPPPARPCGRTEAAGKRSSWASEVTKTR